MTTLPSSIPASGPPACGRGLQTLPQSRVLPLAGTLFGTLFLAACATPQPAPVAVEDGATRTRIEAAGTELERDRRAILAMAGEYEVRFAFDETVSLRPGYQRHEPYRSGAFETVLVIRNDPGQISLQHLLVSADGEHVTKHWRQDWTWQAAQRFEFSQDQVWRVRPISDPTTRGAWTQCVHEVNDAPRYCGTGRWNHRHGVSTWTSDRSWRPLPRREYTRRSDYNALDVENRHTITPGGWTHEQDNTKTLRDGERIVHTLVREFGFNDYRRVEGFDFSPAYDYWQATRDYWARVRRQWQRRLQAHGGLQLKTPVDGMAMIAPLFELADQARRGQAVPDTRIAAVFDAWVGPPPPLPDRDSGPELADAPDAPGALAPPASDPVAGSDLPAY